jgi:hypothetical protein
MFEGLGKAFAKIHYSGKENEYAGCGFLIDSKHLVTCTHVLKTANGDTTFQAGDSFTVDLPFLDLKNVQVELVHHFPVKESVTFGEHEDMALLKFTGEVEKELPLSQVSYPIVYAQAKDAIEIYSTKTKDYVQGNCSGVTEESWLAINTDKTVEPGDSGSPVWNKRLEAVTGMLVARKRGKLTCYVIPTTKILSGFKAYIKIAVPENTTIKRDEEFLEEVKESIATDLNHCNQLQDRLIQECVIPYTASHDVCGFLIGQCFEGNFAETVRNIQSAFVGCWDKLEMNNQREVDLLLHTAGALVSKLVLYNIKKEWMEAYQTQCFNDASGVSLPDMNPIGVEVIVSRQTQTVPAFKGASGGLRGVQVGKVYTLESGIKREGALATMLKKLAEGILSNRLDVDTNNAQVISDIRDTIRYRRKHKNFQLRQRYFLLIPSDGKSPLADSTVQAELAQLIPELEWITLKSGDCKQVFLLDDGELMTAIREFYTTLEKYKSP